MSSQDDLNQPFESGTVAISGHSLHWERYGFPKAGTVMLMHHGLGSVRSWRRQIPAFSSAGWEVVVYDRWGYGHSEPRPEFTDRFLLTDANEAFELLDSLGIDQTALIGHSDGGTIALMMALLQPRRITSMVIVAAHIYYEEKMRVGLLSIAEQAKRPPLATALEREHGDRAETLTQKWVNHWLNSDPNGFDMSDQLGSVTCPTLVVQGELDEHATPKHARDIAAGVQEGELWLVPGVGHMPPHEIPDIFNRRTLDFLAGARL
jgi:pimeloyl-ACP methyl ester carboxylesterase